MRLVTIFSDAEGESHFRDSEVGISPLEFAPPASPLGVSKPMPAEQFVFIEGARDWFGDWHPAPRRQCWVGVSGAIDVSVSDGETRRFGPGSVVLLEDLTGKGHRTRGVGEDPVRGVFIQTP